VRTGVGAVRRSNWYRLSFKNSLALSSCLPYANSERRPSLLIREIDVINTWVEKRTLVLGWSGSNWRPGSVGLWRWARTRGNRDEAIHVWHLDHQFGHKVWLHWLIVTLLAKHICQTSIASSGFGLIRIARMTWISGLVEGGPKPGEATDWTNNWIGLETDICEAIHVWHLVYTFGQISGDQSK
jgi:hypothetical protein